MTGKYKFAGFAPVAADDMDKEYINEEENLSQLTLESDLYWEKKSDNPDDHRGAGGAGTWGMKTFEGTTYIEDVFDDDGNYLGWNANTDPSKITGVNGETIPSSYSKGEFIFASKNGKDSIITSESHGIDDVNLDKEAEELYTVIGGTGRFKGAKGEIFGRESYFGGADITFSTNPEQLIEAKPQTSLDGTDKNYILKDITPFDGIKYTKQSETSLAVGDIDGDGHADIVAGIGAKNMKPVIEIYSGADYSLIGRINPFNKKGKTTINLAAGDINSDNFVDIIVGQGNGGVGAVEAFSGRQIFDVIQNAKGIEIGGEDVKGLNPLNGRQLADATSLFTGDFRPFKEDNYKNAVDVSSGYILPRPENNQTQEEVDEQVIQSSFANLIALKVDSKSTKKSPSIKTFYYTGGSSHEAHESGEMSSMVMTEDIPTLESSLNIQERLTSINGSFIDLSPNLKKRGQGTLIGQLMDGREYAYTINSNEIQEGEMQIFKHNSNSLNPGKTINARKRRQQKKLTGTSGNDHINGKRFKEKLYGMEGEDHLVGRHGNDFLSGGKDNDRLNGGPGRNTLIGGEGKDTFVVGNGFDTIRDFNSSDDVIQIKGGDFQLIANGNNTRIEMSDSNNWVVVLGIEASQLNLIS